ncbi:MAG TPA: hypothetical protein VKE74_05355 [Gemmataceae bacterium]|nr:hypothetical protein [Gemmataceae bacterium]
MLGSALLVLTVPVVAAADPPDFQPSDFPPSTAVPRLMLQVGDTLSVGGPGSANFLPNEWMDVYVVPHRTWREGDPLGADALKRGRVRSDAKGRLVRSDLWKSDRAGQFDIIVDYDGNGRFSYGLDSLDAIVVRDK